MPPEPIQPARASGRRFTPRPIRNDFIDEFHRHLGRLVHVMARFDFNVGLQVNLMGQMLGVDVNAYLDPTRMHLSHRLKRLRTLTLRGFAAADEYVKLELQAWFDRAEQSRALRNDYVHGRWGTPAGYQLDEQGRIDGEPLLGFIPLNWNMEPDQPDPSIRMTVEEFAQQVDEAEGLVSDFADLTDKHARYFRRPASEAPSPGT